MNSLYLAEFLDSATLLRAARQAKELRYRLSDAFSPFPIEGMAELVGSTSTRLRVIMFLGGMATAAACYGTEYWTAVFDFPINSGGRSLNSWPAFMLFPFAFGIFGAALIGLIALFVEAGLPRLHHPLFSIEGFERVTQDRFVLALKPPAGGEDSQAAIDWLKQAGAIHVWEIET